MIEVMLTRSHPHITVDGHPAYRLAIHNAQTGRLIAQVTEVMLHAGKVEYRTAVNQRILSGRAIDQIV